jgi:hypothetical protein
MAIDKLASRKWRAQIRDILNRLWDPIGVYGNGPDDEYPDDEYEAYAGTIAAMIREQEASDEQLMDYLEWAEVEYIGLPPFNRARAAKVVAAVRELGGPPESR